MHASRNEGSRQRIAQDGSMADARRTCVGAQVEEAGSVGGGRGWRRRVGAGEDELVDVATGEIVISQQSVTASDCGQAERGKK